MVVSIEIFLKAIYKKAYIWISIILCGLPTLFLPLYKQLLPQSWQEHSMIIVFTSIIIFLIILLFASFRAFHELRIKRMQELYRFTPEANKGRVFRDLYKLYQEGEFLKQAGTERRQKWDEEILKILTEHFTKACNMNYWLSTRRGVNAGSIVPLDDNKYNVAVLYIEKLLKIDFDTYFKN